MYYATVESPLGSLLIAASDTGITGLWMEGQRYYASTLCKESVYKPDHPLIAQTIKWLHSYFLGEKPDRSALSLAPEGTDFQKEVWEILDKIPYGTTRTYSEIASQIAETRGISSMSSQAVGNAIGKNPISILIPCHRVVGKNGSLTGYAGGIHRKEKLLLLENPGLLLNDKSARLLLSQNLLRVPDQTASEER